MCNFATSLAHLFVEQLTKIKLDSLQKQSLAWRHLQLMSPSIITKPCQWRNEDLMKTSKYKPVWENHEYLFLWNFTRFGNIMWFGLLEKFEIFEEWIGLVRKSFLFIKNINRKCLEDYSTFPMSGNMTSQFTLKFVCLSSPQSRKMYVKRLRNYLG